MPINLRYSKYDGKPSDQLSEKQFNVCKDLSPNSEASVDVLQCSLSEHKPSNWIGFLTTNMFSDHVIVKNQRYDIEVLVTSENGGSKLLNFRFDPEQEEKNMWVILDDK